MNKKMKDFSSFIFFVVSMKSIWQSILNSLRDSRHRFLE